MRNIADCGVALPLARVWHGESRYGHHPFSEKKFLETVLAILRRGERGAGLIALWKGRAVGLINVAVGEAIMSEGGCYATCLAWYVEPEIQRSLLGGKIANALLERALKWSSGVGAKDLFVHGTHRAGRSLVRRGEVIGTNVMINCATTASGTLIEEDS